MRNTCTLKINKNKVQINADRLNFRSVPVLKRQVFIRLA